MKKLFMRHDTETIKDALELSIYDFVKKYKQLTTDEIVSKAYYEIRTKHKPPDEKIVNEYPKERKVFSRVIKRENPNKQLKDTVSDNVTVRKRKSNGNVSERNKKALQLIKEGKKNGEIIEALEKEGYSIHAPQISLLRKNSAVTL